MMEQANGTMAQVASDNQQPSPVIMFKWGSKMKPFRCQLCDMSFEDGEHLRDHMSKHTDIVPQKPFPCKICPKSFQTSKSLERHCLIHYGQALKRCKFCYKVFANKENLEKHIIIHDGKRPYRCDQCGEQFVFKQGLESHMVIHTGVRPFVCQLCNKGFNRKDILERHMIVHSGDKKYKCVECGKSFAHSFVLKRHTRAVHSQEFDGKECELCGKFIKTKENIRRHMKLHSGERPFKCSVCDKTFTQKQHAIDHMVIHTREYPFKCPDCSKEFKYKRSLNRHLIWHAEGNPEWTCDFPDCGVKFHNKNKFKGHIRTHLNSQIQCKVCKDMFKDITALHKHYETHKEVTVVYREIGVGTDDLDDDSTQKQPTDEAQTKELIKTILGKEAELGDKEMVEGEIEDTGKGESEAGEIIVIVMDNQGHRQLVMERLGNGAKIFMEGMKSDSAEELGEEVMGSELEVSQESGEVTVEDAMETERSELIQTLIDFAEQQPSTSSTFTITSVGDAQTSFHGSGQNSVAVPSHVAIETTANAVTDTDLRRNEERVFTATHLEHDYTKDASAI